MITVIVITAIACIALYALNKKGILPFVILFGLVGAVGSDYTSFAFLSIVLTITAAGILNMFYPIEKWYTKKVNVLSLRRKHKITQFIGNVMAFMFCILPLACIGTMLAEGILVGSKSQAELFLNQSIINCDMFTSILFIVTIINLVMVKCIEFIDWIKLRNHHST